MNTEKVKNEKDNKKIDNKGHIYLAMLGASREELAEMAKEDDLVREVYEELERLNKDKKFIKQVQKDEIERQKREERAAKRREARKMLRENYPIKEIAKTTGLSKREIKKLKQYI